MPVEEVLMLCFKNQALSYEIENNTVIISRKTTAEGLSPRLVLDVAAPPITGVIRDADGKPLSGVNVVIKGTKIGVVTNADGTFSIDAKPGDKLVISNIGYIAQEITISNQNLGLISLTVNTSLLDEVQYIAYGTTTQRLNVGNVTIVSGKDIQKQPVGNPLLALEGRVPGLFITQTTGLPGSGLSALIQGQNSIGKGNDPFYVIDGVPYISQLLPNVGKMLGNSGKNLSQSGNPLSFINPSDIESVTILKDANATAIYGSRAANGAILITTKKGKSGRTKTDINLQQGWGKLTRNLRLLNTQEYLIMRHEAKRNAGLSGASPSDYDINGLWDTARYTDWQKVLLGGTAQYTNLNATVSGGNTNTQFMIGATYQRETTVFPGQFADKKGAVHFSINNVSSNQKFRIQLTGNYMIDNNLLPTNDLTSSAMTLAPNAPPLYNADGSLNWMPNSSGTSTWTNPLSYLYNHYTNITTNLVTNALVSYQIFPGLTLRSNFGYTNLQSNEIATYPLLSSSPENRPNTDRHGDYGSNNINSWLVEPQLNYTQPVWKGKLETIVGTTIQKNNSKGQQLYGVGYNSDQVISDIRSASTIGVSSSTDATYKYNALFGRFNYNLLDKYIFEINARRDGSSRFGVENQFHNFGSVGMAWIFSQETFMVEKVPFISFGKLKASYGTTGSDQIGDYQYLNLYSPVTAGVPYDGNQGLAPNGIPNPYLQWEETKKMNLGVDLGIFKDRILLNVNYSLNRSSNQLLNFSFPSTVGSNVSAQNFPATVQNSSFEGYIHGDLVKRKNFTWSTSINLTVPKNKLAAFPNLSTSNYANTLIVGKSISIFRVYHFLGVDEATGLYQVADAEGKSTMTPRFPDDATVVINSLPSFYGGFENNFQLKKFQLNFLFQFVKRIGPNYWLGTFTPGRARYNQPSYVSDRWQNTGDKVSHQKFDPNFSFFGPWSNASGSDVAYSDASFIRLKNISLSWQLPDNVTKKAHFQFIQFYFQGQNLLTISQYKGLDPETLSSLSLPPLRMYTMGLKLGL